MPGTIYSPALVTEIEEDVFRALRREANREEEEGETELTLLQAVTVGKGKAEEKGGSGTAVGFKLVTSCTHVAAPNDCSAELGKSNSKCVDVTIHAVSLRVDTSNPITNLLNIPRSNRPSFLSNVPGPLLAFGPQFGLDYDRTFGLAGTFELATSLTDLSRNLRSQPLKTRRTRLDVTAKGKSALSGSYYETSAKASLSRSFAKTIDRLGLDATYSADRDPLGQDKYSRNAVAVGASFRLRTDLAGFEDVALTARYRWSSNTFRSRTALASEPARENALEVNALIDGHLGKGVSRLGLWWEAAAPNKRGVSYNRLAAIWGYQREFIVVPNQTIGIEALVGAGRAWGMLPQYSRFYGGNAGRNFLYEGKDSPVLASFPTGPLLRSFGRGQAAAGNGLLACGGSSYWNLNLNLSIPIPAWSSPLVPNIAIELPRKDASGNFVIDAGGNPIMEARPLRVILKNQGESSRRVLERIFRKEGLSDAEAQAKARKELGNINSILAFISDQANIYAVKPLFMFDAARLNTSSAIANQPKFAVGAGLQLTVVIAKFEAGYMRTLNPLPGDNRGNFVMRLFFQNLF